MVVNFVLSFDASIDEIVCFFQETLAENKKRKGRKLVGGTNLVKEPVATTTAKQDFNEKPTYVVFYFLEHFKNNVTLSDCSNSAS